MKISPNKVCWNITNQCNLKCKFCYANKSVKDGSYHLQKNIIAILADRRVEQITFSGGEPLMVKYLPSLLKTTKKKGIRVHLSTNGILFNENIANKICKHVDILCVPLDGSTGMINYKMRGNDNLLGSFQRVKRIANKYNTTIRVYTMVTPYNQKDLRNLYTMLQDIENLDSWRLSNYYYVENSHKEYMLNFKQYSNIVEQIEGIGSSICVDFRFKDEKYQEQYLLLDPAGNFYTTSRHKHNVSGNLFN